MNEEYSRIQTIIDALVRLKLSSSQSIITIHIVGADDRELLPLDAMHDAALKELSMLTTIQLILIGPHTKQFSNSFQSELLMVQAQGLPPGLYHQIDLTAYSPPDLIIIFNGGLWGYDSWIPSLQAMKRHSGCYILVTSYTLQEADDDNDILLETFGDSIEWMWDVEANPNASQVQLQRSTQPDNRPYFDNSAYQCFRIL